MAIKNIISPKGSAVYPWLTEPDYKFDPEGLYKTNLVVDAKAAEAFIEKLEAVYEEAYQAALVEKKTKKLKKADMPWEENDDGTFTFKFKLKSKIKSSKTGNTIERKVALFDAKNKPLNPKTIKVGSGSELKISFQPYTWFSPSVGFGLQLQLGAVQILQLSEGNGNRDFGFGEEEGFSGDDIDDAPASGNFDGDDNDDVGNDASDSDDDF